MIDVWLLTIIAVAGIALAGIAWLLKAEMPGRRAVDGLAQAMRSMTGALEAQRAVVTEMPKLIGGGVAAQVREGLQPLAEDLVRFSNDTKVGMEALAESLQTSQTAFTQAVITVNEDGGFDQWVGALRETIEPLQETGDVLERHFQVTDSMLETTESILADWSDQRAEVRKAFEDFSSAVARSATEEVAHLRDIEQRMTHRLEEVAETNALVAESLSALQTASRNAAASNENLARSVEGTVQRVAELIEANRQMQNRHHQLINAQDESRQRFEAWEKTVDAAVDHVNQGLEGLPRIVQGALGDVVTATEQSVQELGRMMGGFHTRHQKALEAIEARHRSMTARREELLAIEGRLMKERRAAAASQPLRSLQLWLLIVAGLQALLLLGLLLHGFSG